MNFESRKMIDVGDWDDLVIETYGKPYSFQQQEGCKSRGIHKFSVPSKYGVSDFEKESIPEVVNGDEMGVSFKAWLARDPKQPLADGRNDYGVELFWERNFYPSFEVLVEDLHKKGKIPKGDYAIDIDW